MTPDLIKMKKKFRDRLFTILRFDLNFLKNNGLMDYSLLLAIEQVDHTEKYENIHLMAGAGRRYSNLPRNSSVKITG